MPLINVDFSRVTYPGALEITAPIIPGGILALGTLILNPQLASGILSNPFLGYRSRLIAAIFVSYVAGLLLYLLVGYTSYFVGYQFGLYLSPRIFPDPPSPWRNLFWRRAARKLLGPDLAPTTDELYFKDLHTEQLKQASQIQDPVERARQEKFVTDFFLQRSIADSDWYWWYQVLAAYFTKAEWWAPPAQYFLSMLHTASWAVIFLMVLNHRHHWFAWLLCILGLFFGNVGSWFAGGPYGSDPYGTAQTARILRVIRSEPQGTSSGDNQVARQDSDSTA